jgi:GNAT superfamily N-acetyltransferase
MDDWRIELLKGAHERGEFCCGKAPLDTFLRSLVSQYEKRRLGRTYVAVRPDEQRVYGYYTLASSSIPFEHLPSGKAKKLPKHPAPVILLARLAVDKEAQGTGLGKLLLLDALKRSLDLSATLGVHAVEVDAIDAEAKAFYEKYGFAPLEDSELHLYLPIVTVEAALGRG